MKKKANELLVAVLTAIVILGAASVFISVIIKLNILILR